MVWTLAAGPSDPVPTPVPIDLATATAATAVSQAIASAAETAAAASQAAAASSAQSAATSASSAQTSAAAAEASITGLSIGTVTVGTAGASITGSPGHYLLNLVIPSTSYTLPQATASVLGGVTVGASSNLTIASGALSLSGANVKAALGYTPLNQAGDTVAGNFAITGTFGVTGLQTNAGGLQSSGIDDSGGGGQFRAIYGNYGVMLRNDGSNFYILLTNSGSQTGGFNALRPIGIALSSGALSLCGDGAPTLIGGDLSVAGHLTPNYSNFRNRIINGDFSIDQYKNGGSSTVTTSAAYLIDRWAAFVTGAGVTGQQSTTVDLNANPTNYGYVFTGATGNTSINIYQRITADRCFDFAGSTLFLSIKTALSVTNTINWQVIYTTVGKDNWSGGTTVAGSGSWTGVGSTPAIYNANCAIPSGAVDGLTLELTVNGLTSGTWELFTVQVERFSNTAFERRPYSTELEMCQQYFQTTFSKVGAIGAATHEGMVAVGYSLSGYTFPIPYSIIFPVQMRTVPICGSWDGAGNAGKVSVMGNGTNTFTDNVTNNYTTGAGFNQISPNGFIFLSNGGSAGGVFIHYSAEAEL